MDASIEQKDELGAFERSAFRAPVLFISHRWRSSAHPDPEGETLARLLELGEACLILDYCSFPQSPLGQDHASHLELILSKMGDLMQNVVVMSSADYLSRGWCVYEYILASLEGRLVCDEIQDERFTNLLRWSCTRAPAAATIVRDGIVGRYANFIQEAVLHSINRILPQFKASNYTLERDRVRVRTTLRDQLLKSLPPRRLLDPYLGETLSKSWTKKELEQAFSSELQWDAMDTARTDAFHVAVASSLREGVQRGFTLKITPSCDWKITNAMSPLGELFGTGLRQVSGHDLGKF